MKMDEWLKTDLAELSALVEKIEAVEVESACRHILDAENIFLLGKGRSGLVMEMFAMRLMQAGLSAFVVGAPTTPAIREGDLLVAGSGSGETVGVVSAARKAVEVKATLVVITSRADSTLGKLADCRVIIPGETTKIDLDQVSRIPLGSVLEQALLVVLDSASAYIAESLQQSNRMMMARHANLE